MSKSEGNTAEKLTEFSLRRKITVLVLLLTIMVVGVIASLGIPLELVPKGFEPPFLGIYVPWANAPTQEVLEKVTLPLEEELSTIKGLDGMNSWSSTGSSQVFLMFKQNADMSVAYREVRDRLQRAKLRFPEDIQRHFIQKHDPAGMPVAVIGMAINPDITDIYNLVQKEVVDRLERLDGVASVNTDGMEEKEILIEIDRQQAESNGLNIFELGQNLQRDNFTLASGHVRSSGKKFLLRTVATYPSLEELENRPISPSVRLKDIAVIKYEEPEKQYRVRVNGKPAVALVVYKEGEANTVEVSRRIAAEVIAIRQDPRFVDSVMETIFNQGQAVEDSIDNLVDSGRIGGFFAALVLFIFLRRIRLTAIITLSIPLSILIALVVMFFMNETLNIITILGLVISIGLLVDNSVVVAENIHGYYKDGLAPKTACIKGAGEIALAITMATLTTIVVFLPSALVEGQGQFFLIRLALPICVSLVGSLFVALVFIPLSVYVTLPRNDRPIGPEWFRKRHEVLNGWLRKFYDMTFERLNHKYNHALAFFMKRRLDMVILLILAFALTQFIAFKNIKFTEAQEEDSTSFRIQVEADNTYSFEDVCSYFDELEKVMETMKEKHDLNGYLALSFSRGGRVEGWLKKERDNDLLAKDIAEDVLSAMPKKPGIKLHYGRGNQNEEAKGKEVFVMTLEGDDDALLEALGTELESKIANFPGVLAIQKTSDETPSELGMVIDRNRAVASNVNPEWIAGVIGNALRGRSLPRFNDDGKEIPVRVRYQKSDRENLDDLKSFLVPSQNGGMLPLDALTDIVMLDTPKGIFRKDKKATKTITAELKQENVEQNKAILNAYKDSIDLPEGVTFSNREMANLNEDLENMQFAALLSVVFIYLLMGFLFESFILPLSIICTIPLAAIGVGWIHYLTGMDIDFLGVVGGILLIGVVVNNGIVLIDYINRLRKEGHSRSEAVIHASARRFRPILMTALTTIIGMIPLTLSAPSDIGISYKSFGLTLIGGMSTATILTLLVVPVFYTFFDDARSAMSRAVQSSFLPSLKAPKEVS